MKKLYMLFLISMLVSFILEFYLNRLFVAGVQNEHIFRFIILGLSFVIVFILTNLIFSKLKETKV